MATRAQKVRLGVFLVITLILLIVSFVIIAGRQLMEKRDIYYIQYKNVSVIGLQEGSAVKYYGINIGQVDQITINKDDINQVTVQISVKEGTPIKEDMVATLVSIGITGLKQIELTGGSNESDFLPPGSNIQPGSSALEDITGKAEKIAEKFELLLNNLNAITDITNQQKVDTILTLVHMYLEENREPVTRMITSLDTASLEMRALMANVHNLVKTTQGSILRFEQSLVKLDTIMNNTLIFSEELASADVRGVRGEVINTLNKIDSTLVEADIQRISEEAVNALMSFNQTITRIDLMVIKSREDLIQSLETLKQAADYLNQFSREISDDPSILLRSKR
ncbi:MAG: phospholipid/cholesterol/gamma-HCH transport system substrate-binding protein [Candidatus Marinimicrobia bacterium]|jgi:phospholipid/cholesterol/gamma-HCH transport system substrate-binding protein|nr:phospholipid/cholesterol/gamma-HCH transport system substrate-binding protein [Candidatus Neomarinimicrobiota bacterium]